MEFTQTYLCERNFLKKIHNRRVPALNAKRQIVHQYNFCKCDKEIFY
jgi:hypothetical protein